MLQYWRVLALVMALMGVGAYQLYGVFSNSGYQPEQPIHYSHALHAGVMKMECLYCHFTAEKSAHAGVPPVEVCMGCHTVVRTDSPEIKKLTEYYQKGEAPPWVRIHRTPDHAYFSHRWHVAAGVACQTCHGPVENMVEVRQWQKLEMGACMTCHRSSDYAGQVNHPATWHPVDKPAEELREATYGALDAPPAPAVAQADGGAEAAPEQWGPSVRTEFAKYHAGSVSEAERTALLGRLQEYKDNIYLHGWTAQLRGKNASVECNICHQ